MADVLALLIEERDRLDAAIAALGGPRRRGRPAGQRGPGRPPGSGKKKVRKRMSAIMKKRWAERKKARRKKAG